MRESIKNSNLKIKAAKILEISPDSHRIDEDIDGYLNKFDQYKTSNNDSMKNDEKLQMLKYAHKILEL